MRGNEFYDINYAMDLIYSTLEIESENKETLPYFFIVGAGISIPEIPGAEEIITACIEKVKNRYSQNINRFEEIHKNAPEKNLSSKKYSYWIEQAYPNRINRSNYFKSIIKDSKISAANILLAQLIQSKKVATTVFTTNFDNKLKQALDLMGVSDVFVADNHLDNLSIDVSSPDIQIAHVHGSYQFYDCANLDYEVSEVTGQNGLTSVAQALRSFLQFKAPIIIGYSGWENDAIMNCLQERITYPIPYNYIWVCHSINDYYKLPGWLKECPNIKFISEYENSNKCNDKEASDKFSPYNQNESDALTIAASTFIASIIAKMKIDTPTIFVNPYLYYSEMLQKILPENEDVLYLKRWAERMRYLEQNISLTESKIQGLQLASNRKDGKQITSCMTNLVNDSLIHADCEYIYKSIIKQILSDENIFTEIEDAIKLCQSFILFIKNHKPELDSNNCTIDALHDVMFNKLLKRNYKERIIIIDDIYEFSKDYKELLEISITALGVKSSLIDDENESLNFLSQLLDMSIGYENEKAISYIRCIALSHKSLLVKNIQESCDLWMQADEILSKLNSSILKIQLLEAKAKIGSKIEDTELKSKWLISALDGVFLYKIEDNLKTYIQVMSILLSHKSIILSNYLNEKITKFIEAIYDKGYLFVDCEIILQFTEIANYYLELYKDNKKNKIIVKLGEMILQFETKMPCECKYYNYNLSKTLSNLVLCSATEITKDLKANYFQKLRALSNNNTDILLILNNTIRKVSEIINEQDLIEMGIKKDFENVKDIDELSKGYQEYHNNDYSTAEQIFSNLVTCSSKEISDLARNNLAYMIRRKESSLISPTVFELLNPIDDKNAFKHMNFILYYLETKNSGYDQCKISYQHLKEEDLDLQPVIDWWKDEITVGNEESKIALIILNSIINTEKEIELGNIDSEKYDIVLLQQLLELR
ncbi:MULTISPECIES: SIR2 family protein [unclassified Dehalobacter]|uniref:SIR2 family protein n=1 Tax=unclassified Dehalobacter TaxID=2635733 RepID=UPI000EDA4FC1|nr:MULTISPECIES: SIR2 family protein [unclassified Dehalobacter]RJE46519.1 hypothetical protein A7K50_13135 [Dehalobacter sp. MCB1]TCX49467.1 hypothetical protein C1I38_13925 [Dehalobacter sp. 12DCB1]TCX49969.1 hypothetical protein C1I36_09065 [Dehalobacter sp. 14DCB1]